jgi:hypothetical protein
MFEIETSDTAQLRRIVAAGSGALLLGLALTGFNLVEPFVSGEGHDVTNVVFGFFGVLAVITATHPTYQAVQQLEDA